MAQDPPPGGDDAPEATASLHDRARARVDELERELTSAADADRPHLEAELGRLLEGPLGEPRRAAGHYRRACELDPTHLPAVRGARRTALAAGEHVQALAYYEAELRLTPRVADRAGLLVALGEHLEDALKRPEDALDAYRRALALAPDDRHALANLERLLRRLGRPEALEAALRERATATRHAGLRAVVMARRAALFEGPLKRPALAAEIHQQALRVEPSLEVAQAALERLLHGAGRYRELVGVLERRAALVREAAPRAALRLDIARIHAERLGNLPEAVQALERALADCPDDCLLLDILIELRERMSTPRELADVVERRLEHTNDPGMQRFLTLRLATLHQEPLNDPQAAVAWYEAALELAPGDRVTQGALERAYENAGDHRALVRLMRTRAAAEQDPAARARALCQLADVLESRLERPLEAIAQYREALVLAPDDPIALRALDRLYAVCEKHRERLALHQSALDKNPETPHRALHLLTIAHLHEEALGEPDKATTAYEALLDAELDDTLALLSLQRASHRAGRHRLLVQALEREAATAEPAVAAALRLQAARVLERRAGDPDAAIAMLERTLALSPGHQEALEELSRVLARLGRAEALATVLRTRLAATTTPRERCELLVELSLLAERRFGELEQAAELSQRALAEDPEDARARAIHERQLIALGRHRALAALWERWLQGAPPGPDRARTRCRLGLLYEERLDDDVRALASQRAALEDDPDLLPARRALTRLDDRKPRDRARELQALAAAAGSGDAAARLWLLAAQLYASGADEPTAAGECLEHALEQAPDMLEALLAMEPLQDARGDREGLDRTYQRLSSLVDEPGDRAALIAQRLRLPFAKGKEGLEHRRDLLTSLREASPGSRWVLAELEATALALGDDAALARVDEARAELGDEPSLLALGELRRAERVEHSDRPRAMEHYRAALARAPHDPGALDGLARSGADHPLALEAAAQAARRAGVRTPAAAGWLLAASALYRERGDADAARRAVGAALELDPDNAAAAGAVIDAHGGAAERRTLLELLRSAAARAGSDERAAALWLDAADVYRALADLTGAESAVERALQRQPDDPRALLFAADLLARRERHDEAEALLRGVVAQDHPAAIALPAYRALADLYAGPLSDPARALACLRAAVAQVPDDADALRALCQLQLDQCQWDDAHETAERLELASVSPVTRAEALSLQARAHEGRGDLTRAVECLSAAVESDGALGESLGPARELAQRVERFEPLVAALRNHAREASGQARLTDLREAARLLGESMGAPERAAELLASAAGYDADSELRMLHARWLAEAGESDAALSIVRALVEAEVWDARFWRELLKLQERVEDAVGAARSAAALCVLGRATGNERALAAAGAEPTRGPFVRSALEELLPAQPADAVANELLSALRTGLPKLFPPDLEAYAVGPEQRVLDDSPLGQLATEVAEACGAPDYEIYLHRVRSSGVALELGEPPLILLPASVADLPPAAQRFTLARPLLAIASGLEAVDKLTPRELEVLLAAGARLSRRDFGRGLTGEDVLNQQARSLQRALGWLGRRQVEPVARAYAQGPRPEPVRWAEAHQRRLNRAALAYCGDLEMAVKALGLTRPQARGVGAEDWRLGDPEVADLLRFWSWPARPPHEEAG